MTDGTWRQADTPCDSGAGPSGRILTDGGQSTGPSIAERVLTELLRVVEPVEFAVQTGYVDQFLEESGVMALVAASDFEKLRTAVEADVFEPFERISTILGDVSIEDLSDPAEVTRLVANLDDLIAAVGDLFEGIRGLDDLAVSFSAAPDLTDMPFEEAAGEVGEAAATEAGETAMAVGERVMDYLLVRYLLNYHEEAHNLLAMAGVIRNSPPAKAATIDLSAFKTLLADTNELPAEVFHWADETTDFDGFLLLYYLRDVFWYHSVPAALSEVMEDEMAALSGVADPEVLKEYQDELRIPVVQGENGAAGVRIVPVPGATGTLPGLALVPFGMVSMVESHDMGGGWTFNVEMSANTDDFGVVVRPDESGKTVPELRGLDGTGVPGDAHAEADVTYSPEDAGETAKGGDDAEMVLLGSPGASRVALTSMAAQVRMDYQDGEVSMRIGIPTSGVMGVHPANLDGFLSSVLPPDGIFYRFDVTVGWSMDGGLYFERGGTLEVSLPTNTAIGPALLQEIYLALTPAANAAEAAATDAAEGAAGDALRVVGASSLSVELGPIVGTVERIGMSAGLEFPEGADGNMGALDLDVGFKPPTGIGLSIDAGAVTGGGYLSFDYENERYAGTLELQIGSLSLTAVGLLTTRLPSGKSGFSLLVLITAEFSPIQLGFGFTLNGLGGLLGINRSFKTDPLSDAVRTGSLDSVLFPEDVVANATRIVSDLRSFFPPTEDVHVFGPMVRLGWGTPTLVTADLGILLEIPSFKIALLGRMSALMPDESAPLIELNMAVLGVLDPPGERASLDASLYDSRVGPYSLKGDMAMRTAWGDDPRFVLSVGGFHPAFSPPADIPDLNRVSLSLGKPGGNPSIEVGGYFAVTSNTVQVGAYAKLRAKAGPASVKGELGFDALFKFDPFSFVVDFRAGLEVRVFGAKLGIRIDGQLSGTAPWRVSGRVKVDLFLVSVSANIKVKFGKDGPATELPSAKILPELNDALGEPGNWKGRLPGGVGSMVKVRDAAGEAADVLVHPLGEIGVRQTVVPLDFGVERFGNFRPADHTRFAIESAEAAGSGAVSLGDRTKENFAPAQYQDMSDAEKLDSPGFEKQEAGRRLSSEGLYRGGDGEGAIAANTRTIEMNFETEVIDTPREEYGTDLARLGQFVDVPELAIAGPTMTQALAFAKVSAAARVGANGTDAFTLPTDDQLAMEAGVEERDPESLASGLSVDERTFVVATDEDLTQTSVGLSPDAGRTGLSKAEARRRLKRFEAAYPGAGEQLVVVEKGKATEPDDGTFLTAPAIGGDGGGAATGAGKTTLESGVGDHGEVADWFTNRVGTTGSFEGSFQDKWGR